MSAAIVVEGLHKAFGEQKVLRGIDLEIDRGELFVLMGLSGTGKSVFLKHLVGLLTPDAGRILVDGVDLAHMDAAQRTAYLKRVGVVFQGAALFDSLTTGENVAFPLREHTEADTEEVRRRAAVLLERVGLADAYDKYPAELSGGMRKRAGLARALALGPDFVYFDEPTSGLDPLTSARIEELILETRQEFGYTGVVITHSVSSAAKLGDRVALLWEGRIRFLGTAAEMRTATDPVVRAFVERDPRFLSGTEQP